MASNQTPIYGLNQWSLDDGIIMADFNSDNQKTEEALFDARSKITELQEETEILRADGANLEMEIADVRREMLLNIDSLDRSIFIAKQLTTEGDEALQNAIETAKNDAQLGDNVLQHSISTLRNTMPKIAVGTYEGTGTGGVDAPNTLTFSFEPKLLIVTVDISATALENGAYVSGSNSSSPMIALRGAPGASFWYDPISSSADVYANTVTWNGKTVSWWNKTAEESNAAYMQLNEKGVTYRYFAIG